ncbi:hypothetical protein F4779DRAFT_623280 [Xylariaceae sp. FL0662B]|nr:hypothetical protein F4779DRAFT_623280 [Xylariaceae sp. FL0662B]
MALMSQFQVLVAVTLLRSKVRSSATTTTTTITTTDLTASNPSNLTITITTPLLTYDLSGDDILEKSSNEDIYHPSFSWTRSHDSHILDIFEKFADDCPSRQPNLQRLLFRTHPSFKRNNMNHENVFELESRRSQRLHTMLLSNHLSTYLPKAV